MDDDDEYEKERLANIRRNQELLKELDLLNHTSTKQPRHSNGSSATAGAKRKPKPAPATRRGAAAAQPERIQPRRTSNRLAGLEADSETVKRKADEEAEETRKAMEAEKRARHEEHDLAFLLGGSDNDGGEQDVRHRQEELQLALRGVTSSQIALPSDLLEIKRQRTGKASDEYTELKQELDKMQLRSVHKAVQRRVYSMVMHPNVDKDLLFIGDKEGAIGVWDPLARSDDDDEYMPSGQSWSLQVHGKSPITCLRLDPIAADSLYSSSYDSTIRMQSLNAGVSTEVWSGQDDVLISIFDILAPHSHPTAFTATPAPGLDERSMWIADHRGGLSHYDLRQSNSGRRKTAATTRRWQVCEKKIGGMAINPTASSCISVASLDQHVRLFDVRNLQTLPTTNEAPYNARNVDADVLQKAEEYAQIAKHRARLACTSVDWDPSGTKLVGVSYDDMIKVWDVQPSLLRTASGPPPATKATKGVKKEEPVDDVLQNYVGIRHNNQTGKWLTMFRARFNANPTVASHFSIGSMDRRAEIWSADGTLLRSFYDEEHVTAVPAVTATHPRRVGRLATGNASGKCTFWAAPE